MYKIIKSVIENRDYELSDIIEKIEFRWINGDISSDEKTQLIQMAREYAAPEKSIDILSVINGLEERIRALEENGNTGASSADEFVAGKIYYTGDIITFNGKSYICIAPEGAVCVWSPNDYPAYWKQTE